MVIEGIIKSGEYFDSVSLMIVAGKMRKEKNVIDSSIVMGTKENRSILKVANLLIPSFEDSKDSDLLVVVSAKNEVDAKAAIDKADIFLNELKNRKSSSKDYRPRSIAGAKDVLPEANLALISVGGKFAYQEAMNALTSKMNVMLFSDNISINEEISLKKYAEANGLIVMGPDCGTAVIDGVPLAFANSVTKGEIGIVAASGTGLQEVSSSISNLGYGVSHAIGTGGRDIKEKVGGISFCRAISMLAQDESTKVIVLISKPPHISVLKKIGSLIREMKKPVVSIFLGADQKELEKFNMKVATTLEEAALFACELVSGKKIESVELKSDKELALVAKKISKKLNSTQKYVRALYSGGTFCSETQLILKDVSDINLYSNAPVNNTHKLENSNKSVEHTILDLGEDEFTVGRPHPMIDFTLRNRRLLEEIEDKGVAVIILDLVIGYGSSMNPLEGFIPTVKLAKKNNPNCLVICFVTGTASDPQNRELLQNELKKSGVELVYSNAQAAKLASMIIKDLQ